MTQQDPVRIHIDSVFLEFQDKKVLRGIYLELLQHQISGILGRNGSGKSCLLKIITGQLTPQQKYLNVGGKRLNNLYKEKGLINYLPQHECHPGFLRMKDLLYFYDISLKDFRAYYPHLHQLNKQKFAQLSGGDKRLLEVLIVLESPSLFTILDEPFSHLIPTQVDMVKKTILRVKNRKGIIITDHQYKHVLDVSDHLHLLKDGRLHNVQHEQDLRIHGYI
ncbi:MAG: ATP-binding cassette domain-containing protein [Bacteroidota bacterium]